MKDYTMRLNVWIKILVFINSFHREVVEIKFYLRILSNKHPQRSPDTWGRYKRQLVCKNYMYSFYIKSRTINYCLIKFVLIQAFNQIYSTIAGKFIVHSTMIFPHTFTLIDNYVTQNNIKMYQQGYENFSQFKRHATN